MKIPPLPAPAQWHLTHILGTAETHIRDACNQLIQTIIPPHGLPGLATVVSSVTRCIRSARASIPSPNAQLLDFEQTLSELEEQLQAELIAANRAAMSSELRGTKTRHPEWNAMVSIGHSKPHLLADTFIGLHLLHARSQSLRLKPSVVTRAAELRKEEDISADQLKVFLRGVTPDSFLGQRWALDLMRVWRFVVTQFSDEPEPPKPTNRDRLKGQIVSATIHGSTQVRAGAQSHRQLSTRQLINASSAIWRAVEADALSGVLGVLSAISTFSVDLIASLPLLGGSLGSDWIAAVDPEAGLLLVDYKIAALEASKPLAGCTPSSFLCVKPLPQALANKLKERRQQYPDAKTLKDLYPSDPDPISDGPIHRCTDGIAPTWARLRTSVSHCLRQRNLNSFVITAVTGDFTIVPRSKWYYASLHPEEVTQGFTDLYAQFGWGLPVEYTCQMNFGCAVVPEEGAVKAWDLHLVEEVRKSQPGRHTSTPKLLIFHNNYMRLAGQRISLLLGLRETQEISIEANVDELADQWIPIDDKVIPNGLGYMPVPICGFLRETIQAQRKHCNAMHTRLKTLNLGSSDLARWCLQVVRRSKVPLLCVADGPSNLRPLATKDFMARFTDQLVLPPDFGRKVLENMLRDQGMRSSDIDSVLRHVLQGQGHANATSDFNPIGMHLRFDAAMMQICARLYGDVAYGLSKE